MEYKVGDRIKIKDDLGGHSKGYILSIPCDYECERLKLKGRECVITKVIKSGNYAYYAIDIHKWWLTEDMFDLVEPKQFTKDDLKPFYVVELRNKELAIICETNKGKVLGNINNDGTCIKLLRYSNNLKCNNLLNYSNNLKCNNQTKGKTMYDIMKVYGYSDWGRNAFIVSIEDRKLLWERVEVNPRVKELENEIDIKNKELKELQIELESLRG